MIPRSYILISVILLLFSFLLSASVSAQNKTVIIPLIETVQAPLKPYAPVTAPNPADTDYQSISPSMVVDKVTGLIWQKEDDNDIKTWDEAWTYCQSLGDPPSKIGSDWRLPRIDELMTIVNYNNKAPAINPNAFPSTNFSVFYWSATTVASNSGGAWGVIFEYGDKENNFSKENEGFVRCVRRPFIRQSAFVNNGDGTVTDMATGLMWQRKDDNALRAWSDAGSYCQGLNLGNKQDWRLPNIKELQTIIETKINEPDPAIDVIAFPGTEDSRYWSATIFAGYSGNV